MTDKLADLLSQLETTLTVAYLGYKPDTETPEDKRWPHFAWRVTVIRGAESYSSDYQTGVGHVNALPPTFLPRLSESVRKQAWLRDRGAPTVPTVADVVSSLMSDASSGTDTFEDFCSNLGYDTDSRKAFDTYLACQGALSGCRRLFREHFEAVAESANEY